MTLLEKTLRFRKKYRWPLTIRTGDVESAFWDGVFQYLPPRGPDWHPLLVFTPRCMDTKRCTLETYQMLATFFLEAAFRAFTVHGGGLKIVVDLRDIPSPLARYVLTSFSDLARGIAMCSSTLPTSISHVHFLEDGAPGGVVKAILRMLMVNLSNKVMSRVSRGDLEASVDGISAAELPRSLGGERDWGAEWQAWLQAWRVEEAALLKGSP